MDRLRGFGSFAIITVVVLAGLRGLHVAVPIAFPATRPGPIGVARLVDVRRLVGFAPMIPAYHPSALGASPTEISVRLSPTPTATVVWSHDDVYLSVTTRRGGPRPVTAPLAAPLGDVPAAVWWLGGSRTHALLLRDGFWIEIETSLGEQELRRFVDTLSFY
jgi:hypothetical protein